MRKNQETTLVNWVMAPGESEMVVSRTIQTPPVGKQWRRNSGALKKEVFPKVDTSQERKLVEQWVNQLIQHALGSRLPQVEARFKRRLSVNISQQDAEIIGAALKLEINGHSKKTIAGPSRNKAAAHSRPAQRR